MKDTFELELGTACNSHCIYCEQGNVDINASYKPLGLDTVKAILDKRSSEGYTRLYLQGGEPTIHPSIVEIVSYAKEVGFEKVDIITNGRLFSYMDYTKKMIKAGIDDITFSIHGPDAKTHDGITLSPQSFIQAIKGIGNLKDAGHTGALQNSTVVLKQNYTSLLDITQLLHSKGITTFHFIFFIPYDNVIKNQDDIMLKLSDAASNLTKALDYIKGKKLSCVVEYFPYCVLPGYEFAIAPNIRLDTLKYNSGDVIDKMEHFASDWVKPDTCRNCMHDENCRGVHRNYLKKFGGDELRPIK